MYQIEGYLQYRYDVSANSFDPFINENLEYNGYMDALNRY